MKVTMNWSADDLKDSRDIGRLIKSSSLSDSEKMEINAFADKLMNNYSEDIMSLTNSWEQHLNAPLPTIDLEKIKEIRFDSPFTDLRFCLNITRAIAAVAIAKKWQGNYDDALKLLLLNLRFSQIIAAGDGVPPTTANTLTGASMAKLTLTPHLWRLLSSGNVSKDLLKAVADNLIRMVDEEIDFSEVLASDLTISKHLYTNLIFSPEFDGSQELTPGGSMILSKLEELSSHISPEKIEEFKSESSAFLDKILKECFELYLVYKNQPSQLYKKVDGDFDSFAFRVHHKEEKMSLEDHSPAEIFAVAISKYSMPGISRTNQEAIKKRYRIMGAALLAFGIYKNGGSIQDLEKIIEDVSRHLPADVYSDNREKCKIIHNDGEIVAYSFGPNQRDNLGCNENDLILFRIPVKQFD